MKTIACLFLLVCGWTAYAWGDDFNGTPTSYKQTINKVEFYNSTTSAWVTVGEGDKTFDLAAVNAGETAGNYMSGGSIPQGVYTRLRVKISRTMQIKGSASHGGTTYYTTTTQQDAGTGGKAVVADTSAPAELGTMVAPQDNLPSNITVDGNYFVVVETLSAPFTIGKNTAKMTISFDVTDAIVFNHDNPTVISWPGPVSVTMTIE